MDDAPNPAEAAGLPQGPHFANSEGARSIEPLRLVLQPSGMTLELTRPDLVIGRHTESDVRLPLPDVSRRHCRLRHRDGQWSIIDLNSLNGVYVNDMPVQDTVLRPGDRLRIGGFTFVVELPAVPLPAEAEVSLADSLFQGRSGVRRFMPPQRRAS